MNKLRVFGKQTEGQWGWREAARGSGGKGNHSALEDQGRSLDFILRAVGSHWRGLNRSVVPGT